VEGLLAALTISSPSATLSGGYDAPAVVLCKLLMLKKLWKHEVEWLVNSQAEGWNYDGKD
jgi:hypothetical protein